MINVLREIGVRKVIILLGLGLGRADNERSKGGFEATLLNGNERS